MRVEYLLILDLKTTSRCHRNRDCFPEIIEFSAVLMSLRFGTIEREFHKYVRPTYFPRLTSVCINQTKIQQNQVDGAQDLSKILMDFMEFLVDICVSENVAMPHSVILQQNIDYMLLCSRCDVNLNSILRVECQQKNITGPNVMKYWVNAQNVFEKFIAIKSVDLESAMISAELKIDGHLNCCIDGARNLARLAYQMKKEGADFTTLTVMRAQDR